MPLNAGAFVLSLFSADAVYMGKDRKGGERYADRRKTDHCADTVTR